MPEYKARIVDQDLKRRLGALGAVLIEGPRACGKTETARRLAGSEILLDVDDNARQTAELDPGLVLEGGIPRLIDEWQMVPRVWDHIRREVDRRSEPGQFILTGSSVPSDEATGHSGAGRITRLQMRPMSLYESGVSSGSVSLARLLEGEEARSADPGLGIPALATEIARGGWPALREAPIEAATLAIQGYIDEIRRADVRAVDGVRRDPERVGQLLQSLARHVGTHTKLATLERDIAGVGGRVERHSIADYLQALVRLKVVEGQPAWPTHLRSRRQQREAPKLHFVDPSLAVAALRATPDRLIADLNYFGHLFESLVVRDLRVYAQACAAQVMQYSDSSGLEADAVVQADDGRWAVFEIKLGSEDQVEVGAESILKFASHVDTSKSGEPATLGVIVGSGYGYVREDGVQIIPIGALGP